MGIVSSRSPSLVVRELLYLGWRRGLAPALTGSWLSWRRRQLRRRLVHSILVYSLVHLYIPRYRGYIISCCVMGAAAFNVYRVSALMSAILHSRGVSTHFSRCRDIFPEFLKCVYYRLAAARGF